MDEKNLAVLDKDLVKKRLQKLKGKIIVSPALAADLTCKGRRSKLNKGCSELTEPDISCWDMSSVFFSYEMFQGCKNRV